MFLSNTEYQHAVTALIHESDDLDIAVAFWGDGAYKEIEESKGNIRLLCNLTSGGTNPKEISKILELATKTGKIALRHREDLHAKVFINSEKVIVGSANMSANGLGLKSSELSNPVKRWVEAGFISDSVYSAKKWFDALFENSAPVTSLDIQEAEKIFDTKRRPFLQKKKFWQKILDGDFNSESVSGRKIFVAIYSEDPSEEGLEVADEFVESGEIESRGDFFEDWTDADYRMEEGQTILSIQAGKGIPVCDGFYRIKREEKRTRKESPDTEMTLHLCETLGDEYFVPTPGKEVWKKLQKRLQVNGHSDIFGPKARLISIEDFIGMLSLPADSAA